jgi:hypothetical protein
MLTFTSLMLAAFPPSQHAFWLAHFIIGAHRSQ